MLSVQEAEVFPGKRPEDYQEAAMSGVERRAQAMDFDLSPERIEAIEFVQDFYEHCSDCKNARQLMKIMDKEFSDKGGKKYLYKLFPAGPLSTIHDLIDLPDLNYQVDKGFGTSY